MSLELVVGGTVAGIFGLVVGEGIDDGELEGILPEQEVLMLRMDVDEVAAELAQQGQLHGRVVDEGTALACGVDLASDDGGAGVVLEVVLGKEGFEVIGGDVELCLDDALAGTAAHGLGVGSLAEDETEGAHDDGLAGACLAGDDGEALARVELEMIDEGVVLDSQELKHRFNFILSRIRELFLIFFLDGSELTRVGGEEVGELVVNGFLLGHGSLAVDVDEFVELGVDEKGEERGHGVG